MCDSWKKQPRVSILSVRNGADSSGKFRAVGVWTPDAVQRPGWIPIVTAASCRVLKSGTLSSDTTVSGALFRVSLAVANRARELGVEAAYNLLAAETDVTPWVQWFGGDVGQRIGAIAGGDAFWRVPITADAVDCSGPRHDAVAFIAADSGVLAGLTGHALLEVGWQCPGKGDPA